VGFGDEEGDCPLFETLAVRVVILERLGKEGKDYFLILPQLAKSA
jgi:hypothetical protein